MNYINKSSKRHNPIHFKVFIYLHINMNKKVLAILFSFLCVWAIVGQQTNAATGSKVKVTKTKVVEKKKPQVTKQEKTRPQLSGDKIGSGKNENGPKLWSGEKPRIGSGEMKKLWSGEQNRSGSGEKLWSGNKVDMKLEIQPLRELVQKIDEILKKSRVQTIKDALSVAKKALQEQMPASGTVAK